MKIRRTLIAWFIVAALISSCSTVKIQSVVSDAEIQIDGSAGDWENIPLFFNKKPAFVLGAVNDTAKLNLMIRFNDPSLAQMMFRRGFNLWFDNANKFGLHFNGRSFNRMQDGRQRKQKDSLKNRSLRKMGLSLQDFDVILKGSQRNINQTDILYLNAASGVEEGLFCFEFSVPLVPQKDTGAGAAVMNEGKVAIKFSIPEMTHSMKNGSSPAIRAGGMSGGMSGGRRGGGRRGSGMKGGGMRRPDMSGIEFKAVVQLATVKNKQR